MYSLLDQIPQTFVNSQETETILEPVIQSGIQALKVRFTRKWITVWTEDLSCLCRVPNISVNWDNTFMSWNKRSFISLEKFYYSELYV